MLFDAPGKYPFEELCRLFDSQRRYDRLSLVARERLDIAIEFCGELNNQQVRDLHRLRTEEQMGPEYDTYDSNRRSFL